jgi:xanthine dehydrogenase accessory factor
MERSLSYPRPDDDSEALFAAAREGAALCTVVGIEGSWSRRLGAQLAVLPDGTTRGSLADGCLERALAEATRTATGPCLLRYGRGSPFLDIRLPCGSAIDVLVEPAPDRAALAAAADALERREATELVLGGELGRGFTRRYLPRLRLMICGSGPETAALARLAGAQGAEVVIAAPKGEPGDVALALGRRPELPTALAPDAWTAIAVLFHDHEWELTLVPWALESPAFYVGAQGGRAVREARLAMLAKAGLAEAAALRLKSPIGLFAGARTPSVLALSILAEVVAGYEALLG